MTRTAAGPRRRTPRGEGFAAQARRAVDALLRQFPELREELGRGGVRSPAYRLPLPAPAPANRHAAEAVEDRAAAVWNTRRGLVPPGPGGTPVDLTVLETELDITTSLAELEEAVHDRFGLPEPRTADVPTRLTRLHGRLDTIARDPDLAAHVLSELRRMARRCARALGDTEPIRRIRPRCPLCDSVSLRVFSARHVVLCVNPGCRCEDASCACHHAAGARHRWERAAWADLALLVGCTVADLDEAAA
ncbi:hypothetical protein [Yinghuangia seranimata]|uniref:hypothetical protein n=1 Tax=Yinghuangia seranimata TaxID=408067 RepID=UPI00248D1782|nr:hypothetical protein [Yinghuangia seranimata]MDI2127414.1 hypothetical protein [Yinghuangia seranimata]